MNNQIKQDQEKLKLFKRFGYDIPKARKEVVSKAELSGRILEIGTGKGHKALMLDRQVILKIMNAERLAYRDGFFDAVISVNFLHHAGNPLKCVKEMVRVTKDALVLADLNKKGERIMDRVHALEGHSHPRGKISFKALVIFLAKSGMRVKMYRNKCETVLMARKGE
jgi:SAM-dependent methyltransferase